MATVNKDFVVKNGVVAGANVQGVQLVSTTSSLPPITVTSSANVSNLNADLLDGQHGSHYLDFTNATNIPDPTIAIYLDGSVSGSGVATLTNLSSASIILSDTIINLNSVTLGAETVGDYVESVKAGTGVTVSHTSGESASPTISIGQDVSFGASVTFAKINLEEPVGAPIAISSSALISNLNSQYLNGYTVEQLIGMSGVQSVTGTANEINVSASTGNIQVGLPDNVTIAGSLTVGENFIVTGSVVTINSTVVTIDDPIFTLGGDTAPTIDDNKDRGIEFRYYDGSAKIGFFGFDESSGKFTFIPDATNTSEVFTGTKGTIDANIEWTDVLNKPDPSLTLLGDVSGNATFTDLGSASLTVTVEKDFNLVFTGDVTGTGTISNLNSASISLTIGANSIALGTDTTGDYVSSLSGGDGITVNSGSGEGSTPTISVNSSASVNWANINNKPSPVIGVDLTGDVTGAASATLIDLANGQISIATSIAANSVALGSDTTGSYVALINGTSNQINVSGSGQENATVTISLPQDIATTSTPSFAGLDLPQGSITSASATVSVNNTPTVVDTFLTSAFTTAEYTIRAKQGTKMTTEKILVMWDGTDVLLSEYSIMDAATGAANITFSATESDGTVSLTGSSPDAASTNIIVKAVRTAVDA